MHESKFFIIKANTRYEILQEDGSYDEYLRDGMQFRTKQLAEKYINQNKDKFPFELKIIEVWM